MRHIHALMPLQDAARAACISHTFLQSWRCYPILTFTLKALGLDKITTTRDDLSRHFRPPSGTKWLILGDFNLIYRARDKNNRNLNLRLMRRFRTTLEFCELKEIRLQNRKFTWCNERRHPTLVKLTDFFATRSGASVLKIMFSTLYPQPTRSTAHCFLAPKWGHVSQPLSDSKIYGSAFRAFTRSSQRCGTPRLSIQSLIIA